MQARGSTRLPLPLAGSVVGLSRGAGQRTYKTRVEWAEGTSMCVVAPRPSPDDRVAIADAEPLEVVWSNERGLLQASGVLRAIENDVVELWVLDVIRVERSQRREAFRLPVALPTVLRVDGRAVTGESLDLSETGMGCRVAARGGPELLDDVEVELAIADEPPLILAGRVVRERTLTRTPTEIAQEGPGAARSELGIAFVGLDRVVTDRLRRYVFDEQLRRRSTT